MTYDKSQNPCGEIDLPVSGTCSPEMVALDLTRMARATSEILERQDAIGLAEAILDRVNLEHRHRASSWTPPEKQRLGEFIAREVFGRLRP